MATPDYSALIAGQREYFLSGATRPASWRKAQLKAMKAMFAENHDELCDALWKDLRRNVVDAAGALVRGRREHGVELPHERTMSDIYKKFRGPF